MKRKSMKKILGMLLALCLTLLPVIGGLADEGASDGGEAGAQTVSEEKPAEPQQEAPQQEAPQPEPSKAEEPPKEQPKQEEQKQEEQKQEEQEQEQQEEEKPEEEKKDEGNPDDANPDNANTDKTEQNDPEQGGQNTEGQTTEGQEKESSGDGDTQTPDQDPTQDTETPAAETTSSPEPSAEASATPEETPPVLMLMDTALTAPIAAAERKTEYDVSSNTLKVTEDITINELQNEIIAEQGNGHTVKTIQIESEKTLSGTEDNTVTLPVINNGTISGGTYSAQVTNNNKISGGTFNGSIENYKEINGGTYTNRKVTINGAINVYDGSSAKFCLFGKDAKPALKSSANTGNIEVYYKINNDNIKNSTWKQNYWTDGSETKAIDIIKNAINTWNKKDENKNKQFTIPDGAKWYYYYKGEEEDTKIILDEDAHMNLQDTYYVLEEGDIYFVKQSDSIENVLDAIQLAAPGTVYKKILVKKGVTLSSTGNQTIPLPVENCGKITGGNYTATVTNNANATITGGTFSKTVTNKAGATISGGTFAKGSTLNNSGTVTGGTVNGKINALAGSKATGCKFGDTATGSKTGSGSITVTYYKENTPMTAEFDTYVSSALGSAGSNKAWFEKLKNSNKQGTEISTSTKFKVAVYKYYKDSTGGGGGGGGDTTKKNTPTPTPKPSPSPSAASYSWEDDLENAGGEDSTSVREQLVDGYLKDGEGSDFSIVQDTESKGADYELIAIVPEDPEAEADEAKGDGGMTASAPAYDWDDEEEEETPAAEATDDPAAAAAAAELEAAAVPGEADAEGVVPGTLLVRAEGNGSQTRKLTLTLSQIQRIAREQQIEVLLFRNGATTMSMDVSQFYHGNIAKLMKLMLGWQESKQSFAEQDISEIDFDAIQLEDEADAAQGEDEADAAQGEDEADAAQGEDEADAEATDDEEMAFEEEEAEAVLPGESEVTAEEEGVDVESVYTEEQLREFRLELTIAPATPVGYSIRAELRLGDEALEISSLLEKLGVTLHAEEVAQAVAVYYLDDAQQRFKLDTHRGRVPGVEDRVKGYEVSFVNDESTVMSLDRSVSNDEFAGYCAIASGAGTYYIGVLPTTAPTATPAAS